MTDAAASQTLRGASANVRGHSRLAARTAQGRCAGAAKAMMANLVLNLSLLLFVASLQAAAQSPSLQTLLQTQLNQVRTWLRAARR